MQERGSDHIGKVLHDLGSAFGIGRERIGWTRRTRCLACAVARFFHPGYDTMLLHDWLPALDGVIEKLERGARVADVGCGHGVATLTMAAAFPGSQFVGFDGHEASIVAAREHARSHGSPANLRFEAAGAKRYPGNAYDLVTCFDSLREMGDPTGVAAHVQRSLKPDGTWMIVEPCARARLDEHPRPAGRLHGIIMDGGFACVRRAAATPTDVILEARPQ